MKNDSEFRGFTETAKLMLKGKSLNTKSVAKQLLQCFRLSEDYDSDSDASDEDNKKYHKGYKSIVKMLEKSSDFTTDDKLISLK